MKQIHHATPSPLLPRPRTVLRACPVGECVAMLIAVQAFLSSAVWIAVTPRSLAAWLILPASLWIMLRSAGFGSGRIVTSLGTVLILVLAFIAASNVGPSLPVWLIAGPFSPWAIAAVLSGVLIVDLCDIPWSRGRSPREMADCARRFLSRNWGWGLGALFAVYMVVIPGVHAILELFQEPESGSIVLEDMSFAEAVLLRTTEVFTAVWFFVFGAAVGSFLNVVVYRTPRGDSLIRRASACPKCHSPIAGRDNIPILGWMWLKGRCRSCQLPISIRYPLVETVTGLLFLVCFFAELLSGGSTSPSERRMPTQAWFG